MQQSEEKQNIEMMLYYNTQQQEHKTRNHPNIQLRNW